MTINALASVIKNGGYISRKSWSTSQDVPYIKMLADGVMHTLRYVTKYASIVYIVTVEDLAADDWYALKG